MCLSNGVCGVFSFLLEFFVQRVRWGDFCVKITTNSPQLFLSALLLFLLLIMDIITRSLYSRGSNNQLRSTDLFRSMIIKNNKSIVVMTYFYPLAPPSSPPLSLEVDLDQSEACLVHSVRGVKNLGNGWSKSFFS